MPVSSTASSVCASSITTERRYRTDDEPPRTRGVVSYRISIVTLPRATVSMSIPHSINTQLTHCSERSRCVVNGACVSLGGRDRPRWLCKSTARIGSARCTHCTRRNVRLAIVRAQPTGEKLSLSPFQFLHQNVQKGTFANLRGSRDISDSTCRRHLPQHTRQTLQCTRHRVS